MRTTLLLDSRNVDDKNDAVNAVLAIQREMCEMMVAGDLEFGQFISEDFIAADPSNTIRTREELIDLVSSGRLAYTFVDTEIDAAKQLGEDLVVLMGTESTKQDAVPTSGALEESALAGTLHRRFTDLYRHEEGSWKLLVKQSTLVSID